MPGSIDFSCDPSILITLLMCLAFPLILALIARMKIYRGKNAHQFLISSIIITALWVLSLIFTKQIYFVSNEIALTNVFIMISALLLYLEIWGLLSRGYTIGLLLTFYHSNRSLNLNSLAKLYRAGSGLEWLMEHRISGLVAADMLLCNGKNITLTRKGYIIAYLYQLTIRLFGLRYTG